MSDIGTVEQWAWLGYLVEIVKAEEDFRAEKIDHAKLRGRFLGLARRALTAEGYCVVGSGEIAVLLRRLGALELAIRVRDQNGSEFCFDQVLSAAQAMAGTRGRQTDEQRSQ